MQPISKALFHIVENKDTPIELLDYGVDSDTCQLIWELPRIMDIANNNLANPFEEK